MLKMWGVISPKPEAHVKNAQLEKKNVKGAPSW